MSEREANDLNGTPYIPGTDPEIDALIELGNEPGEDLADLGIDVADIRGSEWWDAQRGVPTNYVDCVYWRSTDGGATWKVQRFPGTDPGPLPHTKGRDT